MMKREPIRFVPECANYDVIKDCLRKIGRPATYLEIGCCEGHSLYRIMETGLVSHAVAVDTWGDQHGGTGRNSPAHVTELLGDMMANVMLLTGDSKAILPAIRPRPFFDVIFVDGDHSAAGARADMDNSLPLLNVGGFMVVDDIDNNACAYIRGICRIFARSHNMNLELFPAAHQGVAVLQKTQS